MKESFKENNEINNKKDNSLLIIIVLGILLIGSLGFICYDKFINTEPAKSKDSTPVVTPNDKQCEECQKCDNNISECNCPTCTSNLGEKINTIKEVKVNDKNQTIKIGKKEYKVRRDSDYHLLINDESVNNWSGDEIYADHGNIYLTDKFLFVTVVGQFDEWINYALGENGEIVANNNGVQMKQFKVTNGYLHATGGVPIAGDYDMYVNEHDLLIKYIDNTLIVVDAK